MADVNRRKGGPTAARSHQAYMQNAAQNPQFQAYQQHQQQLQHQQQQAAAAAAAAYQQQLQQQQMQYKQHQQHQQARMSSGASAAPNRYARGAGPVRGQQKSPVSAKMGIKSGMTVEVSVSVACPR